MDFRELNYVLAIAKYQNITKAADALFISQPTLSKFLISLEEELGLRLFRKAGHKIILTYAGERYIEKAAEILRLKQSLDHELSDIRASEISTLHIGFTCMRCSYMFPEILPRFHKRYPNVKVILHEGDSQFLDTELMNGKIELAFCSKPVSENPKFEYHPIFSEQLLFCMNRERAQRLSPAPSLQKQYPLISPDICTDQILLRPSTAQRTGQYIDEMIPKTQFVFKDIQYIRSIPAIAGLVAADYGVAFLPESYIQRTDYADRVFCYSYTKNSFQIDFAAATRKGTCISNYADSFLKIVLRLYGTEPEKPSS